MAYWLIKTEPSAYSYDDLERDGRTRWDGVTNNTALIHLRGMKEGDLVMVYHSGAEKSVVGIAKIIAAPYADPRRNDPKIVVVDIAPLERFARTVPLAAIKALKEFATFPLVRISRLSVMPVSGAEWKKIVALSH